MQDRTRRTLIAVVLAALVVGAVVGIGCQQAEPTLSLSDQAAAESARLMEQAATPTTPPAVGDLVRVRTRTGRVWVAIIERIDRSEQLRDGRRGLVVATRPWHGDIKRIY